MENQPIARLTFTCNRNWEEMTPVAGGRFCNDCQKKVVDFTGKTNDEIAAYLMSSTTKVCGKFTASQLAYSLPKPIWKRWLSAAAMFVAVFMGIKEASAQQVTQKDTVSKNADHSVSFFGAVEKLPEFPGGEKKLNAYLSKNLKKTSNVKGRVIASFVVEKDGSLTDFKVLRGLSKEADEEAIRVLKACPKWHPSYKNDLPIKVAYALPIDFGN